MTRSAVAMVSKTRYGAFRQSSALVHAFSGHELKLASIFHVLTAIHGLYEEVFMCIYYLCAIWQSLAIFEFPTKRY